VSARHDETAREAASAVAPEHHPSPTATSPDSFAPAAYQPWWLRLLPFLGRVPEGVSREQVKLLGAVALALLFEHYDVSTLGNASKYIRASFELPQSEVGRLLAWVRLGAVPAVLLVPFADHLGRKRLFMFCLVGSSVGTLLTAFTQTLPQFIAAQMIVRSCLIAGSAAAFVIVAEEFPAQRRGWAIGILGALALLGFGLGAALFSLIERLPYGWRSLYIPGLVPMLLLPYFARRVPETQRFQQEHAGGGTGGMLGWLRPFITLARHYPARMAIVSGVAMLAAVGHATAHGVLGDYVLTDRGWAPGRYSTLVITGGALGIIGNTVVGRLADRMGRRSLGFVVLAGFPPASIAVYSSDGWLLAGCWIVLVFITTGGNTIIRALSTELFPTSSRSTAAGSLTLFETLGAVAGLYMVTAFTPEGTSIAGAVRWIVCITLVSAVLVLFLPETARKELEDISARS
jgi:MFS family permease